MPIFDITDGVTSPLGLSVVAASSAAAPSSMAWDCNLGGLPFLFANSDQYPMKRETATFRRDRIDTERNPGEQSLDSGYWLRSQASWHYGSGLSSAEPLEVSEQEAQFRYQRGGGVNVWTAGQVSLLNDTSLLLSSAGSSQHLVGVDTGVLHADGTTVKYVTLAGSATTVTWGGSASSVTSLASDGASYYAANNVGIYKGTLPSTAGSKIWDTGATTVCRFVKSRLFAAVGLSLYELITGGPALPTALFTHPSAGWTWTDIAEGPGAIYAAGYVGDQSYIYKITVTSTTTTVTLDQPIVVAEMPRGELVRSLYSYVGSYLVVGTNQGVRVASINTDDSLSLGPQIVSSSDGCLDAVADGSFVYVTMGSFGEAGDRANRAGLWRIDLGTPLNGNPLLFAAASDLVVPSGVSGAATQVTTAGGLLHFAVSGVGVYQQSANYVASGWMETGRVRLGTVESKAWRSLRVLGDGTAEGYVTAHASTVGLGTPSTWDAVISNSESEPDQTGALNAAAPSPSSSMYLAFRLVRSATTTSTPVFIGYQLKAVPAPIRAELVQIPVMCFDRESDRKGSWYGDDGKAWERFRAVKELEASSSTVQWLDYTTGEAAEAYIEQVALSRTTPPTRHAKGAGGIMTILLRLV